MIEREIRIEAPPMAVYRSFVEPDRMAAWMGVAVDLDPRPGGALRVNVTGQQVAVGQFVELDPPRRVVFTWGWEEPGHPVPPGSSTVEVTLTADGAATVLRLVHRDLPDETEPRHDEGWDHYLGRLAVSASGGSPGPDPWAAP